MNKIPSPFEPFSPVKSAKDIASNSARIIGYVLVIMALICVAVGVLGLFLLLVFGLSLAQLPIQLLFFIGDSHVIAHHGHDSSTLWEMLGVMFFGPPEPDLAFHDVELGSQRDTVFYNDSDYENPEYYKLREGYGYKDEVENGVIEIRL